jgi:cytochrome c-type biogenesis protein CcmH/NrfF
MDEHWEEYADPSAARYRPPFKARRRRLWRLPLVLALLWCALLALSALRLA